MVGGGVPDALAAGVTKIRGCSPSDDERREIGHELRILAAHLREAERALSVDRWDYAAARFELTIVLAAVPHMKSMLEQLRVGAARGRR